MAEPVPASSMRLAVRGLYDPTPACGHGKESLADQHDAVDPHPGPTPTYTLFAPSGMPLTATGSVRLEFSGQLSTRDPTSGAPSVRRHDTVVVGDSLSSPTDRRDDPGTRRGAADSDGIDPMRLAAGAESWLPADVGGDRSRSRRHSSEPAARTGSGQLLRAGRHETLTPPGGEVAPPAVHPIRTPHRWTSSWSGPAGSASSWPWRPTTPCGGPVGRRAEPVAGDGARGPRRGHVLVRHRTRPRRVRCVGLVHRARVLTARRAARGPARTGDVPDTAAVDVHRLDLLIDATTPVHGPHSGEVLPLAENVLRAADRSALGHGPTRRRVIPHSPPISSPTRPSFLRGARASVAVRPPGEDDAGPGQQWRKERISRDHVQS
ncbi:hypothetical protein JOD57_000944 [Geodermatophilus bullaregiensis]|nr:hypothetical protein [Geodermatophilus bullaregiensis]